MRGIQSILFFVLVTILSGAPAVPLAAAEKQAEQRPTPTPEPERHKKDGDSDEGSIGRVFRSIGKAGHEHGEKDNPDRGNDEGRPTPPRRDGDHPRKDRGTDDDHATPRSRRGED
jgi:hypothetical protein